MKPSVRLRLFHAVVCVGMLLAWVTPVQAQLGPGHGAMPVSPLFGESPHAPRPKASERAKTKRSHTRIRKLLPLKKQWETAADLAKRAAASKDLFQQRRWLRTAIRKVSSTARSLEAMRKRWGKDLTFARYADRLAYSLRKDRLRFKRLLKQADAEHKRRLKASRSERATAAGGPGSTPTSKPSATPRSRPSRSTPASSRRTTRAPRSARSGK